MSDPVRALLNIPCAEHRPTGTPDDCAVCGTPVAVYAELVRLRAEVAELEQARDWLLGRMLDMRASRWVNERLGEFTRAELDAMLDDARADLRRRSTAPDDADMGGPASATAGYFRRLARGEA